MGGGGAISHVYRETSESRRLGDPRNAKREKNDSKGLLTTPLKLRLPFQPRLRFETRKSRGVAFTKQISPSTFYTRNRYLALFIHESRFIQSRCVRATRRTPGCSLCERCLKELKLLLETVATVTDTLTARVLGKVFG